MRVRALRGATSVEIDGARQVCEATGELLAAMLERNALSVGQVISLWLTVTPDLRSEFPARGARDAGWGEVPMMCAVEVDVPGATPRCIRALVHIELPEVRPLRAVYLRDAAALRPDLR